MSESEIKAGQTEILADAATMRTQGIPGSVVWIDNPWQTGYNSHLFDTKQFPDAKGTIAKRAQVDENDPDSEPVPDTCTVTLSIERVIDGVLDPAWGGGRITSVSRDSRDITSNL